MFKNILLINKINFNEFKIDNFILCFNRLDAARRENESLYARLSALDAKGSSPVPPTRSRSLDSLSDLTNIDLDIDDIHQLDKDR